MLPLKRELSFGDRVGKYRLIAELARGGMGVVYLASAQGPGGFSKLVALKELRAELVEDSNFLTMFLEEARMAARLSHSNIVQTNDVKQDNGRHFIVMEYLDGRSLNRILQRFAPKGGFPVRMSLLLLRDALSALAYAHELHVDGRPFGFIHRDISPHNIFVTFDGHTKVIDFGIAKARDSSQDTKTGVLKGKAGYMAPEVLLHKAEPRSDVFSLGAVLYEVITGQRLWQGLSEVEILAHLIRGDIPTLQMTPSVPAPLSNICHKSLCARVEDRFANAAEMRDVLDEYLWQTGGAPQLREIGGKLMEEFGVERIKTRELVETYLARLQVEECEFDEDDIVSEVKDAPTEPHPFAGSAAERSSVGRAIVRVVPKAIASLSYGGSATLEVRSPRFALTRRHIMPVAASGIGLLGVFVGFGMRETASSHGPGMTAAPVVVPAMHASAPAVPTASPIGSSETILFSLSVLPSNAEVSIDGEVMPSNPFLGRLPRSETLHRVRATAPGFQPKERLVTFNENVILDLNLNAKPASHETREAVVRRRDTSSTHHVNSASAHSSAVTALAPPPVSPSAPAISPRSAAPLDITLRSPQDPPLRRAIDSRNPYGDDK